jgi:hypothetical protein
MLQAYTEYMVGEITEDCRQWDEETNSPKYPFWNELKMSSS